MDAILTSNIDAGRELKTSNAPVREARTVYGWSGNNIFAVGDTGRRTVPLRLYSQEERPQDRRYEGLEIKKWAKRYRPELFVAAISVVGAYILANRPKIEFKPMGSFDAWDETIRAALIWAGEPDPCSNRNEIAEEDTDRETALLLMAFLEAAGAIVDPGKTTAEMIEQVKSELSRARPIGVSETSWTLTVAPSNLPSSLPSGRCSRPPLTQTPRHSGTFSSGTKAVSSTESASFAPPERRGRVPRCGSLRRSRGMKACIGCIGRNPLPLQLPQQT